MTAQKSSLTKEDKPLSEHIKETYSDEVYEDVKEAVEKLKPYVPKYVLDEIFGSFV